MLYKIVMGDGEVFYGFIDQEGKIVCIGFIELIMIKVYWGEKLFIEV